MTKEQVIAMAREAGATPYTNRHYPDRPTHTFNVEQLEKFATLVRNAALEESAVWLNSYDGNLNSRREEAIRNLKGTT